MTDDGHPGRTGYLSNLGIIQYSHFECIGLPCDLENAISNQRKAVELTNYKHPMYLMNFGTSLAAHFGILGDHSALENAISIKETAIKLTDDGNLDKPRYLAASLGMDLRQHFVATGCLSDLEHAILNIGKAVALMDDGHQDKLPDLLNLSSNQITLFG